MKPWSLVIVFVLAFGLCHSDSSINPSVPKKKGHALFFFPIITKSAMITFMPVAEEMAKRGHQVTVVTPYPSKEPKNPKIREIIAEKGDVSKFNSNFSSNVWKEKGSKMAFFTQFSKFIDLNLKAINETLEQKDISDLWHPNASKVDLIISMPMSGNEVSFYLARKLNATMVIWSSQQNPMTYYDWAIGQPHNPAYIGNFFSTYRHPMTFFERVGNTLGISFAIAIRDFYFMNRLEEVIDYQFPEDSRPNRPSLKTLETHTGLALQFSHPLIMDGVRPMAPNFINVGMMNCRAPKKLPNDLQKFLDESGDEGAILVSFGTVMTAADMPEEMRIAMLSAFSLLKQRVIWKWETEYMPEKTDNVLLSKWVPQQDVLAHPKIKLFVSHGGQSSCQESLCHQKPMVIVPVFGDQPANGQEAEIKGYGRMLPLTEVTSESLYKIIRNVLDDPKYARRAEEHGSLLMDEINKPLERAIWWLEYAIRHPGMAHLRSPMHEVPWYQLMLLDVVAFFIVIALVLIFVLKAILKFIIRLIVGSTKKLKSD